MGNLCENIKADNSHCKVFQADNYTTFNYKLSNDPKAAVHIGWLIGVGSLVPDIVSKINE